MLQSSSRSFVIPYAATMFTLEYFGKPWMYLQQLLHHLTQVLRGHTHDHIELRRRALQAGRHLAAPRQQPPTYCCTMLAIVSCLKLQNC